ARPARHARPAVAGGGRVRGGVDRAVHRPQDRRPQAQLPHRPGLPADRPGLGAVQALPPPRLALVGDAPRIAERSVPVPARPAGPLAAGPGLARPARARAARRARPGGPRGAWARGGAGRAGPTPRRTLRSAAPSLPALLYWGGRGSWSF